MVTGHDSGTGGPAVEDIHLPPPSLAPAVMSVGVLLLSLGLVYGLALIALGAVIMVMGLATWLIDDARAFVASGDGHGGH